MSQDKKMRVEFAPGCFDDWDGTQEELDAMVAEIQRMAQSGELVEQVTELVDEDWDLLPEEEKAIINHALIGTEPNTRH